jgi:hypothetical protein
MRVASGHSNHAIPSLAQARGSANAPTLGTGLGLAGASALTEAPPVAEDRQAMEGPFPQLSTHSIVRRYYGVWLAYSLAGGFLGGVHPLFLRARGLNQFEINSVLAVYFAVYFAVAFLFDVPTGAFADALGRRPSFIVGCLLRCLGFGLYFLSHTYVLFLIAEAIERIGNIEATALPCGGLPGPREAQLPLGSAPDPARF